MESNTTLYEYNSFAKYNFGYLYFLIFVYNLISLLNKSLHSLVTLLCSNNALIGTNIIIVISDTQFGTQFLVHITNYICKKKI